MIFLLFFQEIGVGTEQPDERPSDNESQVTTRPITVPTIIQSDDFTSEVRYFLVMVDTNQC